MGMESTHTEVSGGATVSSVNLIQGDCLIEMKQIPAGSVDAVITDPPYGIQHVLNWQMDNQYDRFPEMEQRFSPLPFLDYPTVVMFGANNFSDKLPLGGWLCWDKRLNKRADKMFGSPFELAWYKSQKTKAQVKMIRVLHGGAVNADGHGIKRVHPTQKPVLLMEEIVEMFTNRGDTILDPFMGSGTTGVACVNLRRKFIGIEINKKYFEMAQKRIEDASAQMTMDLEEAGDEQD